jgi:hypothetical protein
MKRLIALLLFLAASLWVLNLSLVPKSQPANEMDRTHIQPRLGLGSGGPAPFNCGSFSCPKNGGKNRQCPCMENGGKCRCGLQTPAPPAEIIYVEVNDKNIIERAKKDAILLTVEGAVLHEMIAVRVFVIRPGIPLPTNQDDPCFIGEFSLGYVEEISKPHSHVMNLAPTILRIAEEPWFNPKRTIYIAAYGVTEDGKTIPIQIDRIKVE